MTCKSRSNSMWQHTVRKMLSKGYGVEDISVLKGFDINDLRAEVKILRKTGDLEKMFERYRQ